MYHPVGTVLTALLLSACSPPADPPQQSAPTSLRAAPDQKRDVTPLPPPRSEPPTPPVAAHEAPTPAVAQSSPQVASANTQYVCVWQNNGESQQTPLAYAPNVAELCNKHPEMGPCRYERDVCRRGGGRVFTASGVEITTQTEAEYDKRVTRVRLGN